MKKHFLELGFVAFLLWLYGGDAVWRVQAASSQAAVLNPMPHLLLSVIGLLTALALAATIALHLRNPEFARAHRLALAAACALVFLDFTIISSRRSPALPEERIAMAVQSFSEGASEYATADGVPTDRRGLAELAAKAGLPPVFRDGVQVERWDVELRDGCSGPAADARTAAAGTLIYCRSTDGRRAWVSAVAVPLGTRFGSPGVISIEGLFSGEVGALAAMPEEAPPGDGPVWGPPTPDGPP